MKTTWALVNIPKNQQMGEKILVKPLYPTEADVTTAIANGELMGFQSLEAYRKAKEYQKELKAQEKPKFRAKKATAHHSRYTYVAQFS